MSKLDFREVWKFPLHADHYGIYAFSKDGVMALTFGRGVDDRDLKKSVVDCLNGEGPCKVNGTWSHDGCRFFIDGEFAFIVRGWGHLIGTGGLHLPEDDAVATQNDFINYIFERLNGQEDYK